MPADAGLAKTIDFAEGVRYPRATSYTNLKSEGAMSADFSLEADEYFSLFVLIAQTKDAMLRARQVEYDPHGISNERRALLWIIQSYGGKATPAEIGRRFFRELHSITEMLKRMEKDGLVTRHQGSGRSKSVVKLTEKGSETLRQSLHNETDRRILSVLSSGERDQLAISLGKLREKALAELGVTDVELSVQYVPSS